MLKNKCFVCCLHAHIYHKCLETGTAGKETLDSESWGGGGFLFAAIEELPSMSLTFQTLGLGTEVARKLL